MSKTRRIGVSYARFSDPKQAAGDSEGRQDRRYREFCANHNLTPLTEVFLDRGRSGYHDQHRKKGRLGVLISYAKDGRFEPGTVIVIEAWDRLGRLRPDRQTELVAELLRTGVEIGVCRLNDVFTEEDFGTHKWTILSTFIMLAYQESKQKAERVSESYEVRRARARAGQPMPPRKVDGRTSRLLTDRLPFWLEPCGDGCRPVPERVAALRRLFELASTGYGRSRIVGRLTEEGVPPFGKGKEWTRAYVGRILSDRRVLGEYQPRRTDDTPDGPPIPGYYPRVISEDEWLLSRAGQEERRATDRKGRALVRSERKWVNLFRGMLTSAIDGEGFYLHQRVEPGGTKKTFFLCNHAGTSGRTRTMTFPYLPFEEAVLRLLREVDPREVLPKGSRGPSRAEVLRARLANVREDMASIKADLKARYSKALGALLVEKEAEETAVADELQEELARSVVPAEKAWQDLPGLADLVKTGGDEARVRLRPVLRRLIDDALVLVVRRGSFLICALQIYFHGGARRDFLLVNQAAGCGRRGGCHCKALPDALPGRPSCDLRTKEGVKVLQAVLEIEDARSLWAALKPKDHG